MKHSVRKNLLTLTLLLVCAFACVQTAFADTDDDVLRDHANKLASSQGVSVGGMVKKGNDSNQFQLNSTSASNGRTLYYVDLQTITAYERVAGPGSNCHMNFSIYYIGNDNKLYYTDDYNFNDYAEDFLDRQAAMRANQNDALSIQLPNCKKIVGFFFEKAGGPIQKKNEWSADWLRIAKVSGSIGKTIHNDDGYKYREFSGTFVAGYDNMEALNKDGGGNHLWTLKQPTTTDASLNSAAKSIYMLEFVTGADGYKNKNADITINYTDSLGISYNVKFDVDDAYEKTFPGDQVNNENWDNTLTNNWLSMTTKNMKSIARNMVGNYYHWDETDTAFLPYTATQFHMTLPQNIVKINSIKIKLESDDNLSIQSVRFLELTKFDGKSYWNGAFSQERISNTAQGYLMALCQKEATVTGGNEHTWKTSGVTQDQKLTHYTRRQGPFYDPSGTNVGISIQFADIFSAGVESLASQANSPNTDYNGYGYMKKNVGENYATAWGNLTHFCKEFLSIRLRYKDTYDATREVTIPFYTAYMSYILVENDGKLGSSPDKWIASVMGQNETAALPFRLSAYKSLISMELVYGDDASLSAFTSEGKGNTKNSLKASDDTIAIDNVCFYEGVNNSNFRSPYSDQYLTVNFSTSLTAKYHYAADSANGRLMSNNSKLSLSLSGGSLKTGAPAKRALDEDMYLLRLTTSNIEGAASSPGTNFSVALRYLNESDSIVNSASYDLWTAANGYYGNTVQFVPGTRSQNTSAAMFHAAEHMVDGGSIIVPMKLESLKQPQSLTIRLESGEDDWQVCSAELIRVSDIAKRTGVRQKANFSSLSNYAVYDRTYTGEKVAYANTIRLISKANNTTTINFVTFDESGKEILPDSTGSSGSDYLTSIPAEMTYQTTLKNLGLAIPKYTYKVEAKVADVDDAGSANIFYFQLMFENGSSAVVLANQQLESDTFRKGYTEAFNIQTTQNYGNVKSVRIICDTSASGDTFDKLNLSEIKVTLTGTTGVSRSWIVQEVGWLDILYEDEGADDVVEGFDDEPNAAESNAKIVKEFPITRTATAVDLLFCIATDNNSPAGSSFASMGGQFAATLYYRDSDGFERTLPFDLVSEIRNYSKAGGQYDHWIFRPNHNDRFTLSLTDVSAITALKITRTKDAAGVDGSGDWMVSSVSIQQIAGLEEPIITQSAIPGGEFYRQPIGTAVNLATSTNEITVSPTGNGTIGFTEHKITTVSDSASWTDDGTGGSGIGGSGAVTDEESLIIDRVPDTTEELLNVYLFPGSVIGADYEFTTQSPAIRAATRYTTIYGGVPVQSAFTLGRLGTIDGQTVMYGKGLTVSAMSTLRSLTISTTALDSHTRQPYVSHALIERIKGGVIMDVYYMSFNNWYLGNGKYQAVVDGARTVGNANQVVQLQLTSRQAAQLTAETNDIAVALRYTSALDPDADKTIYQSPYVYLTDADIDAISGHNLITLPFDINGIGEVVGLSVVSTGPEVEVERARVLNYSGDPETNSPTTFRGGSYMDETFTADKTPEVLTGSNEPMALASFTFATGTTAGHGTAGRVDMDVTYIDSSGTSTTTTFTDIAGHVVDKGAFTEGSVRTVELLLPDAVSLESISVRPRTSDNWGISTVTATLTSPEGSVQTKTVAVNILAEADTDSLLDVSGDALDNSVAGFSLLAKAADSGNVNSTTAGNQLWLEAYPGDTITFTPTVTVTGNPDQSLLWNMPAELQSGLDQTAHTLKMPVGTTSGAVNSEVGKTYNFTVVPTADPSKVITVYITVKERPASNGDKTLSIPVELTVPDVTVNADASSPSP